MKKRKLLSLLLAAALLIAIVSGCGEKETGGNGTDPANDPGTSGPGTVDPGGEDDKPQIQETGEITYPVETNGRKLTMWCPLQPAAAKHMSSLNEHEIIQEIERRTGIEVEFIHPAIGQEAEQLNLLVTGGELPDIINIRTLYSVGAAGGVDEGDFLDLTNLMAQYAPDYYKAITSKADNYRLATTNDNRIVSFEMLKPTGPEFTRVNILTSTVEKYGIDKLPVTLDDYEALFAKLAADGIPGITLPQNGREAQFMWPFGIDNGYYIGEDGNIKFGPYTQEYKDYLTKMHDWYEKGYIDKDFSANLNESQRMSTFVNGQVGVRITSCDNCYSSAIANGDSIVVANYPRLYEGQEIHFRTVYMEPIVDIAQTTVISAKSKNWDLAMAYLNYFYTEEGATLCNWGIEGKHYTVDENGVKHYTDYMLNNPDVPLSDTNATLKLHLWPKIDEGDVVDNPITTSNPEALALRTMYSDDPTVDSSQHLPGFKMETEAANARGKIQTDIATYVDEMTVKFITGATPLSEFDNYMATLEALNIQEAIRITNEQYTKFLSKQVPDIG